MNAVKRDYQARAATARRKHAASFKQAADAVRASLVEFGEHIETATRLRQGIGTARALADGMLPDDPGDVPIRQARKASPQVPLPPVPPFNLPDALAKHDAFVGAVLGHLEGLR
jgi:hypothetical protein